MLLRCKISWNMIPLMNTDIKFYPDYKSQPLRPLEDIGADILDLERETEGLLAEIL